MSEKGLELKNLILMTILVSICVHIHVFDFRKIHGPVYEEKGQQFFTTENFKGAQLSPYIHISLLFLCQIHGSYFSKLEQK